MANGMHTDGWDIRKSKDGAFSPAGKELSGHLVWENPTPHEIAQHGADARSGPLPGTEDPIPARLLGKRKGPLNAHTGRQANGLSL